MHRISYLLVALLMCSFATSAKQDYVKNYHPYINKAEIAIVEGHYEMALEIYKSAFKKVSYCMAKDVFNAAVCAIKTGDNRQAFIYCDSLIAKGVTKSFFETDKGLAPLRSSKQWSGFIRSYGQKRKATFVNAKHKDILARLIRLEEADKLFRRKEGSYQKYGDTITAIDYHNEDTLMMIWDIYGFPGEWLVGTDSPRAVISEPDIVLWHHCQLTATKGMRNLAKELKQAVKDGQVYPFHFGELMCGQNDSNYNLMSCGLVVFKFEEQETTYLVERLSPGQVGAINLLRIEAGLERFEEYFRKAAFAFKGGVADDFAFRHYKRTTMVNLPTQRHFDGLQTVYDKLAGYSY